MKHIQLIKTSHVEAYGVEDNIIKKWQSFIQKFRMTKNRKNKNFSYNRLTVMENKNYDLPILMELTTRRE